MAVILSPHYSSGASIPTLNPTPSDGELAIVRGTLYRAPELWRYYSTSSKWEPVIQGALGKAPYRGLHGCELHWHSKQRIEIQAGASVNNGTGPRWFSSTSSDKVEANIGVGWGGVDYDYGSGGNLPSGWYRIWMFARQETDEIKYVLSQEVGITGVVANVNANTTGFPSGSLFEFRRKIGVVYYDTSAGFRKFIQAGGIPTVEYLWMSFENAAGYQVLSNGRNTAGTTIDVSKFCPEEGRYARIFYKAEYVSGTAGNIYIYPPSAGGNGHAISVSIEAPLSQGELIIQPSASEQLGYFCQYSGLRCSIWMKSTVMLEPY